MGRISGWLAFPRRLYSVSKAVKYRARQLQRAGACDGDKPQGEFAAPGADFLKRQEGGVSVMRFLTPPRSSFCHTHPGLGLASPVCFSWADQLGLGGGHCSAGTALLIRQIVAQLPPALS